MTDAELALSLPIMRHLALFLCLTALCAAEDNARRAISFNPRVSAREIAFNEAVRVQFTTTPVQRPEIDPAATVRSALESSSAREQWRVVGVPEASIHERLRTVEISFLLAPRQTGTLTIPPIPARWLEGDQVANCGEVTVRGEIRVGGSMRPLPLECSAVAGVSWDASLEDLRARFGAGQVQGEAETWTTDTGLRLVARGGRLAQVELPSPGVELTAARAHLVERWGDPTQDQLGSDKPSLRWVLGWLRIDAKPSEDGFNLLLLREDVDSRIQAGRLERGVFRLLDGPVTQ